MLSQALSHFTSTSIVGSRSDDFKNFLVFKAYSSVKEFWFVNKDEVGGSD